MNVAYLKVMCGLCFNLFPFFSQRQTADVRHRGGICPSIMISKRSDYYYNFFIIIYKIIHFTIDNNNMWQWTQKQE